MLKIKMAAGGCAVRGVHLLLTGCSIPMPEKKRCRWRNCCVRPTPAGDYSALQTALNDWLGKRPAEISAAGRPAVALCAAGFRRRRQAGCSGVLHHGPHLNAICVAAQEQRGAWQVSQTVEGLADSVDNVRLAQLQAGGTAQLVLRGLCGFRRMTTIWPFTPMKTARCRPSSGRPL